MKRFGRIYDSIFAAQNIQRAIKNVAKGKKDRREVNKVLINLEDTIKAIQDNPHISGDYKPKIKIDQSSGKTREILEPKFYPDQIIHHALCQVIEPAMMRGMYKYCCGSVKKRGMLYASKYIRRALVKDQKNTRYYAKLDVVKYYDHINHEVLKEEFRHVIKDKRVLGLMDEIVDSVPNPGLPIGNYTSQWFANYYLQEFDHFVKEELHIPYYVRYMDDMVIIGPNRKKLEKAIVKIQEFLENKLKLKLHDGIEVRKVAYEDDDGNIHGNYIDFCGYKHYRGFTTIRKRIWRRIHRLLIRLTQMVTTKRVRSFMSYYGYIMNTNSRFIEKKYFQTFSMKEIRLKVKGETL